MRKEETMELDDLKARWNADVHDAIRINTRAARALRRSESSLRRHGFFVAVELFIDAILLLVSARFSRTTSASRALHPRASAAHLGDRNGRFEIRRSCTCIASNSNPVVASQSSSSWRASIDPHDEVDPDDGAAALAAAADRGNESTPRLRCWAIFEMKWIVVNALVGVAFSG
jgi:hypothetical protein